MPSPYPLIEGAPLDQISQRFLDVTVDVPDIPFGGVVEVGDLAVDLVDQGMDWRSFAVTPLTGLRLRHAINETVSRHSEAGVQFNEGLRYTLPFTYELVTSGTVHAINLLHRRDDSATTEIKPIDPLEVGGSEQFLLLPDNRRFVRRMFGAVRERLARTDVSDDRNVELALNTYRPAIIAISQRYKGHNDPASRAAKQAELNEQRGRLMRVAGPAIREALEPFAGQRGVRGFAGALACAVPSEALIQKHAPSVRG